MRYGGWGGGAGRRTRTAKETAQQGTYRDGVKKSAEIRVIQKRDVVANCTIARAFRGHLRSVRLRVMPAPESNGIRGEMGARGGEREKHSKHCDMHPHDS